MLINCYCVHFARLILIKRNRVNSAIIGPKLKLTNYRVNQDITNYLINV